VSLNRRSNHLLRDMVMKMRSVFILLLIVAYAGPYLSQGYVYTSRYGAVLNAWGTFACAMSNAKILLCGLYPVDQRCPLLFRCQHL